MLLDINRFPLMTWLEEQTQTFLDDACELKLEDAELWPQAASYASHWLSVPLIARNSFHPIPFDRTKAFGIAPRSVELLESRPEILTAGFSILDPGAHIFPHVDAQREGTLRGHLGLVIPPEAGIRVANRLLRWEQGKALLFDGSLDHEAANPSAVPRIIMLVDFYLTKDELQHLDEVNAKIEPRWREAGSGSGLFSPEDLISGAAMDRSQAS